MDNERLGEIVDTSVASGKPPTAEQVAGVLTDPELLKAARARGLAVSQAATSEAMSEAPNNTDVLATLSPEQHERARALQSAMAEKFSTEQTPLTPEDFGVVLAGESGGQRAVVMLTTGNGLYKGSYNSIMSEESDEEFVVKVDGEKVDTRSAMTWEVYEAFIKQAIASGIDPLPDSQSLSEQNDQPWTATSWLNRRSGDEFYVYYGSVDDVDEVGPSRGWCARYDDRNNLRVRPAAAV